MPKCLVYSKPSSVKCRLPSKVIFHQMLSSIKGGIPSKVVFHQRSSSVKGYHPSKVVFCQRLSSIKCLFPLKVVLPRSSSSTPEVHTKLTGTDRQTSEQDHILSQADALTKNHYFKISKKVRKQLRKTTEIYQSSINGVGVGVTPLEVKYQ